MIESSRYSTFAETAGIDQAARRARAEFMLGMLAAAARGVKKLFARGASTPATAFPDASATIRPSAR